MNETEKKFFQLECLECLLNYKPITLDKSGVDKKIIAFCKHLMRYCKSEICFTKYVEFYISVRWFSIFYGVKPCLLSLSRTGSSINSCRNIRRGAIKGFHIEFMTLREYLLSCYDLRPSRSDVFIIGICSNFRGHILYIAQEFLT